jgi:23S rRNA-/tRNA-specific pseudouridylate synthase
VRELARKTSAMMRKKNERQIRSKMVEEQAKQQGSGAQMTVESMKNDVVKRAVLSCVPRTGLLLRTCALTARTHARRAVDAQALMTVVVGDPPHLQVAGEAALLQAARCL